MNLGLVGKPVVKAMHMPHGQIDFINNWTLKDN